MMFESVCRALVLVIIAGTLTKLSQACPPICMCDVIKGRRGSGGGGRRRGGGGTGGRVVYCDGRELTSPIAADLVPKDTVLLDLSNNGIKTLRQGAFEGMDSVKVLNLSMNSISYIAPRSFDGLNNLQTLDLSHNRLGSVNNTMFIGLGSVTTLILSHNQISTIAEATFERLTELSKVDFQSEFLVCDCKLRWMVRWEKNSRVRISDSTTCASPKSLRNQSVHSLKRGQLHCNHPLELNRFEIHPSQAQLVFKGDPITLECIASYQDETQTLVWLRNNKELRSNSSAGISISTRLLEDQSLMTSTLTIDQIQMDSSGLWKMECRVRTRKGNRNMMLDLYVFGNFSEKCSEDTTHNNKGSFHWPTTIPTRTASIRCPNGGGIQYKNSDRGGAAAKRFCTDTGEWLDPQTDICQYIDPTTIELEKIALASYNNVSMALKAARKVEVQTADAHTFGDKLIVSFVAIFIEKVRRFTSEELGQVMINIASNLMEANASVLAESQAHDRSCTKIVEALEDFASNVLKVGRSIDIDHYAPNIAVRAIKMAATNSFSGMLCAAFVPGPGQLADFTRQNVKCHMSNVTSAQLDVTKGPIETSIRLPPTIFQGLTQSQRASSLSSSSSSSSTRPGVVLQFFVYKNGRLFPSLKRSAQGQMVMSDRAVTSMVVSSKIDNYNVVNLTDPVTLTFRPTSQGHSAVPAYWNFTGKDSYGEWRPDGCKIVLETDNMTTVQCNHLTNFAILKDFSDPHERYIGSFWMTATLHPAIYIGSFILLLLLFITLLTYICFHSNIRMKRKCRHSLINICLAVMLLAVFYTGGVNRTSPPRFCQVVGVGLHYFTVCALMWMVIQANNLRKALVRRNRPPLPPGETPPPPRPILRFYFVGWGIPMIIVGITAAASQDMSNYGGEEFCWIVDFKVSLAAFFGIAAAMVILTCGMFVWASMHINRAPSLAQLQALELRDHASEQKDGSSHRGENGIDRQPGTDNESVMTHRTGVSGLSSLMDSEYTFAKQITAAVLMLLGFVGTWTFGALAVTQDGFLMLLFCYLYGGSAVGLGLFIFVYNCGMRSDVKYNWKKTCGCIHKDQYTVAVTSTQVTAPQNNGHVVQRRQSASSVDSNVTNRSNNTNHSYPSVVSGSRKTTSKCNYVPSHTNTGTDASIDSSTQDNAGRVHTYDKHRSNGYPPHRYHKQGRSRQKNHKHSRYSQLSRDGQEAGSSQQMMPVLANGAGRTGSSSSFPISHTHHVDPALHSPSSSNPYLPQHMHYMGGHPRPVPLAQELHSSHSGLGINSQPEALCTTQSWDALRENSLPRSTASSDRFSRDRTGFVQPQPVKHHYIDCPPDGSMSRRKQMSRDESRKGSLSKSSGRDRPPRHEDIAEYPSAEANPLLERTPKPPTYEEASTLPESQSLIGGSRQFGEETANCSESEHSRVLSTKDFQMSQSALGGDKRETSV
ncbi:adhesion G protein-coupled receptor A3-like [Diadema antillarum]|uniref:adhesion G protein-coupled receptor A3-like n=1 Tax=Diadema antillarum TaxID=105358 RepID=UPI003A846C63